MYSEQKLQEAETDTAHSGQRARDGARRAEYERETHTAAPIFAWLKITESPHLLITSVAQLFEHETSVTIVTCAMLPYLSLIHISEPTRH